MSKKASFEFIDDSGIHSESNVRSSVQRWEKKES